MLVTDENGIVLDCSDTLEVADDRTSVFTVSASNFAGYKADNNVSRYTGPLMSSSQMVTIDNLSAREVDQTLYIARYTPSSSTETQLMGITHAISIANYCSEVIKGDNVYYLKDDNYSETKAEQDKAVAAAFINYAVASKNALAIKTNDYVERTIDLLEFGSYLTDMGSTSEWYDTVLADNGETGADWDNAIIIDSAEEFVYLSKVGGSNTAGKYYKVADNIAGFDLSAGNLDFNGTLEENLDKIKASGKNHAGGMGFQGYFDGNGATVYGAWTNHNEGFVSPYVGLFSQVSGTVVIKNINVKLSYFVGTNAAGGIVGYYKGAGTGSLTIENCSVTDTYIESQKAGYGCGVGAIVGYAHNYGNSINGPITVKNCFVNLDEDYFISQNEIGTQTDATLDGVHGGLLGFVVTNYDNNKAGNITDCVVIGITPYATTSCTANNNVQHSGLESHFANIYTTDDVAITSVKIGGTLTRNFTGKIIPLTDAQLKGLTAADNMSALNWETVWYTTESYPQIYTPYNVPDVERTIYWDNTVATGFASGTGEKNDPYIIDTASQLAYLVSCNDTTLTQGKYFKIADGIKNIVLQSESKAGAIMALDSAAETKSYFESESGLLSWKNYGWEGSSFCGYFDGNGATVYGLYMTPTNNAGLFSSVDAGATIKNIALKNSYLTSTSGSYQVGGIAAVSNGTSGGLKTNGVIWIDGCTVANNYMYNVSTGERSGVIFGAASDAVYIDNCLVYGNDATSNGNVEMPIISTVGTAIYASTAICPEGLTVITHNDNGNIYIRNMMRNTITLGTAPYNITSFGYRKNDSPCFENVYTDAATGTIVFASTDAKGDYYTTTYNTSQIKHIEIDDIYGSGAVVEMPNLDWYDAITNPDGVWYFGYNTALPSLSKIENVILPELQESYNAVSFTTPDTIGAGTEWNEDKTKMEFGVYATALSLKANPYMSFAFAFHGDYRTNRDKIQVKFTYTVNGAEYVYGDDAEEQAAIAIPAYVEGEEIRNVNGWTNTKSAVRYHTFKASFIPVEAMVNGIKIEANYNGNGWVDLGTFSVDGIGGEFVAANEATPCDYYATRVEAAKAFKFYVQQVYTRYGTIQ